MSDRCSVTVRVPAPLQALTGGREQFQLEARTVEEVLEQIRRIEPLLAGRLFSDDGNVVRPGAVVTIVPSVAGG